MKFKKYTGAAIALAMLNVTVAQADVIRSEADINDVENNSYDEVSENMDQANLEVEPRNDHNAEIISGRHEDINNEISELEMPEQYNDEDFIQEEVDSTIFTGGDLEEVSGEELTEDELSDFTEYNPEDSVEDYFASINEINFTHTRGREALSRLSNGANLVGAYDAILNYLKKVHSGQRNLSIIQSGGTYYTEKIDISAYSLTIDEYKKVFLTIRYDNPQFFWIGTKYAYTRTSDNKVVKGLLKVENHFTSSEKIQASKRQLNNVIQEYLSEVSSLTDEYDIEKAFHDKLIRQTIYDPYYNDNYMINVNSHNVLGVLVDHVGVCESYAKAMQMLLTAKGIENLYLTGRVSGGGHAWNQVKIHGQYYNLDVTWDDKDSMESGGISYKYFNVPNSIFYRNHTANDTTATVGTNEFLYEKENCTAAEYCWDKTLSYADSNDETKIHEFIVNAIEKNLRTNNYDIFLNGQDNSVVEKINLYLNSNREDILSDSLISDLIRERTTGEYFNNPINNSVELCFVRNSQQIPATSITMPDEKRITVLKNSKYLSPIVDPDNTTSSIVWSSSNSSVARVDPKGCIVPLQTGEATITATMGSVRAQCLVKVESPLYIDTTGLQRLYYDNLNKDESTYTLTAWQAFQSALRSAYKILNIGNPTQSEVNDAISVLQNAINGLVQRGDKSALQSLYDQCVDKVESEYSQSTWQPFKDALDAALIVLNNEDAVQSEIDNAKEDLQNGVDNLISLVRFNELRQLYNNNINRNQDDYVSSTWLVFESALGNAQSVLENDNASDRDIISAKEALQNAVDGLIERGDKTSLRALYNTNKDKVDRGYTMSSWNDFRNALISVQDILDNEDATQGEVDNGYISLQNAISRLTSSSSGGNLLGGGHSSGGSHSSGGGSLKSESISEIKNFSYINITLTINDKVIHSKEYKDKKEGDTEVLNLINGFRQALNIEKEFSLSDFRRFNSDNLDALVLDIKNTVNNCIYLYCNGINEIDKIGIEKVFEGKAKYIYCIDKTTNKLVENNIIEKDAKSEISIKKDSGYIISDKPMDSLKDNSWNKCDNSWMYVKDGHVMTGWMKDTSNKWYYSKANGIMQTGWLKDTNGSWYHLGNDGAMNTGWIQDNSGKWYHLNSSGVMDTGWFKDIDSNWYQLGNDGAMKTGWFNDINGKWYYLKTSGAMAFNTIIDGYELGNDGALI